MTWPYVVLSAAMTVDGYLDDNTNERLILSNEADFDRVDEVRAQSDAILIGAETIRKDNPRLIVRSKERREARIARGRPEHPLKVTITKSGRLDREAKFWHHGGEKVVYCPSRVAELVDRRLGDLANVVGMGETVNFTAMLDNLGARGVEVLMVEGGGTIHTQFLALGLADELQLAVAPFFAGSIGGARFVGAVRFPQDALHRMMLVEARAIGDIALMRYVPQVHDRPAAAEDR